jgi:hypothetical protein
MKAQYTGQESTDDAANFVCKQPRLIAGTAMNWRWFFG